MTRLCGICRQTGHNRQTCPQNPRNNQQSPPIQPALGTDLAVSAETARNMRKKWRDAVLDVCSLSARLQRFIKLSYEDLGQLPLINGGTWDSYSTLEDIRIIYPTWLKKKVNVMNLKNPIIAVVEGKLCINDIIFEHHQLRESKQYLQSLGYSEVLFYPADDEDLNKLEEVMSIMSEINCEASGDETLSYYLN